MRIKCDAKSGMKGRFLKWAPWKARIGGGQRWSKKKNNISQITNIRDVVVDLRYMFLYFGEAGVRMCVGDWGWSV